jgi:RNA polymerase sigma-70 factor (ECF subfamily)
LQRAHKTANARLPEQSQQATLRALGDTGLREIVTRYVDAWERRDVDAVVAMLTDDTVLTMPPRPTWYRGRAAVAAILARRPLAPGGRWRLIPARANAQLAFGKYRWDSATGVFLPHGLNVLTVHRKRIADITAFITPELFARCGLPDQIRA